MKLENFELEKIETVSLFIYNGLSYINGEADPYSVGGGQTLAHCLSCFLYQEFDVALNVEESWRFICKNKSDLRKSIIKLIEENLNS